MRKLVVFGVVLALFMVSVAPAFAAPAQDTTYVVKRGDTLYSIAQRFGVTVSALVAANHLANASLIFPGQTLVIPGATASTTTAAGGTLSNAAFKVSAGSPIYSGDGRVIDIPLTITNVSVSPAIAGGKYTSDQKPDGNFEDVALAKASHGTFEEPMLGKALVWRAVVHLSDGTTHTLGVGCRFLENVHAEGDEPLDRAPDGTWLRWYHYTIDLPDGWFDCGNTYRINPPNIALGSSGSSLLTVYLVNPHNLATTGAVVGTPYPGRRVTRLDVTVFTPTGTTVGTNTVTVP